MEEIGEVETAAGDVKNDVDAVYASAKDTEDDNLKNTSSDEMIAQLKQQTAALAKSSAQLLPQSETAVSQMYSGWRKSRMVLTGTEQRLPIWV